MKKMMIAMVLSSLSLTAFSSTQTLTCKTADGAYTASVKLKDVTNFEADLKIEKAGSGVMTLKDKAGKPILKSKVKIALQGGSADGSAVTIMSVDQSEKVAHYGIFLNFPINMYGKDGQVSASISYSAFDPEVGPSYDDISLQCVSKVK